VSEGTYECAHVVTHANAQTHIASTGTHVISGANGQYVCAAGHQLHYHSNTVSHVNVGSQYTHVVGCDSCGQAASIEHDCDTPGSCAPTTCGAGGNYNLLASGKIHVNQNAHVIYNGATSCTGAGQVLVEGTMEHQAAYTSNTAHVVTGAHIINQGYATSFGSLSYGSASSCTLVAGASGYTASQISGAGQLGGTLHLKSGSYAPSGPVTLMTFGGGCTGQFASVTSDSAAKGYVQYTANSVVWYPSGTTCTSCSYVN
jgi:hypothetical protein